MDQQIGNYLLLHPLGGSNFSTVFLGEHRLHGTQVAIKLLYGEFTEEEEQAFLKKTQALSQLEHPHIVPIQDFGVEEGVAYVVMDYASQGTLRQRYPRGARILLASIPTYVEPLATALHYVHEQGLIHRDVKPHNFLLDAQGKILLSDFGAAIDSYSLHPEQASLKDFEGTVLYAAPEQLQGRPCRASDQYALGVVVYEWICGDWPFTGTFHEVVHQHLFIPPPPLAIRGASCPANIERVVMRALAKDPRERFPTIKLFADELTWACKIAQARGDLALPDTAPLSLPLAEASSESAMSTLALPATAPLSVIQSTEQPKRQFKSPLPFRDQNR